MHPFEYADPETLDEALALLALHGAEAKALAGGQSLIPALNYRLARPRIIVDVNRLPLGQIRIQGNRVTLGMLTRYCDLEESTELARVCPILGEAAGLIGNVRVRALGTVGGSLAHADPAAELPLVMMALDASLTLRSARATRRVPAADFMTGYLTTVLQPDELVTEIEVPVTRGKGTAVEELARRAGDFAMVAVAAVVSVDRRGRVDEARLAYGGVGPRPLRARPAEDALIGQEPTAERLALAARTARALHPASRRRLRLRRVPVAARRGAGPPGPHAGRASRPGGGMIVAFTLNGRAREVDVPPNQTLLRTLRDTLGVFDAKEGCDEGVCGACTVLLDGRPVSSCLILTPTVRRRRVLTVRGLERDGGELHPLQEAFLRHGAVQCGFCTPGMLLTALAFLERQPHADRQAIREALAGNLCRCTGYAKILDAVEAYAAARRADG